MKQFLYTVGMKDNKTSENISLKVWAANVDEATHKVVNAIGGYRGEYIWRGSGPIYENNKIVSREI